MEAKGIKVNPVRHVVCGTREMLDSEAVTTIFRLGSEVDRPDVGPCAQHSTALPGCGRAGGLPAAAAQWRAGRPRGSSSCSTRTTAMWCVSS